MRRKLLSILLILAMVLTMVPMMSGTTYAASYTTLVTRTAEESNIVTAIRYCEDTDDTYTVKFTIDWYNFEGSGDGNEGLYVGYLEDTTTGTVIWGGTSIFDNNDFDTEDDPLYVSGLVPGHSFQYAVVGYAGRDSLNRILTVTTPVKETFTLPLPPQTVTGVSITESEVTVDKGGCHKFSGVVSGNVYDDSIVWSVSGNNSGYTSINPYTGLLNVGSGETNDTLTITAAAAADSSKTATATVHVVDYLDPYIAWIKVTPETYAIHPGQFKAFAADVKGTMSDKSVTWSVEGATSSSTTMTEYGRLTIGSDEAEGTLTVKATSTQDPAEYGTATVTVTEKTKVSEVNLIYESTSLDLNTAWTEGEVNKRVAASDSNILSTSTNGVTIYEGWLVYDYDNTGEWYGIGNGTDQVDAAKTYGLCFELKVDSDHDWIATAKGDTVTGLKIRLLGVDVTSKCEFLYNSAWNYIRVWVPIGSASTTPRVTGISISESSMAMEKGGSHTFSGEVTGTVTDKSIQWSVSGANSSSTTINSSTGALTIGEDETAEELTVTATAAADSSKTASITIDVVDELPYISSVSVSPSDGTVHPGKEIQMSAAVEGTQTDKSVTWTVDGAASSKTSISSDGLLTVGSDETAAALTVKATADQDTTKVGTATVSVVDYIRVTEVDLTYDADALDLNTIWTEGEIKTHLRAAGTLGTTTDVIYIDLANSSLVYDYNNTGNWCGVGDGSNQVDASKTYGLCYNLELHSSDYDWISTAKGDTVTGLTIKLNGADVTAQCYLTYISSRNEIYVYCPIGNASDEPRITDISITDSSVSLNRNESHTFTASVTGNVSDKTVTWSVSGAASSNTVIDAATGALTIGQDEMSSSIKVTATSNAIDTQSAATTVYVNNPAKAVSDRVYGLESTYVVYDGTAKTPALDTTLVEGTDYTVTYKDNVEVGTATVTVKGIGNFTGEATYTFTITQKWIGACTITVPDLVYNGTEQYPTVTVAGLTEGTDYSIEWTSDNYTNVGLKYVKLTGMGNYNGDNWVSFRITQKDINEFTASVEDPTYDGCDHKPPVSITGLTRNVDFYVTYLGDYRSAGAKTLIVTGQGNYTGTMNVNYSIAPKNIADCNIDVYDLIYDGTAKYPTINAPGLTPGTDYTVTYPDDLASEGTKTVTFTGIGNYTGTVSKTYAVGKTEITDVVLSDTSYDYTGAARYPGVTVYAGDKVLTLGTDYTVNSYENNVNAGTYTIEVTGTGKYKGTISQTYTINAIRLTSVSLSYTTTYYTGKARYPKVTVYCGDKVLTLNTDYVVNAYKSNVNTGTYTVKVTGAGNYKGTIRQTYVIKPATASVKSLTSGSRKLTVKAATKASSKGGSYYQIAYKQKGTSKWKYTTTKASYKTIKSLKKGKTYYVKIRACKKVSGKTYYGAWSKIKLSKKIK